jgi:RND family efflux transporter MFP subunit
MKTTATLIIAALKGCATAAQPTTAQATTAQAITVARGSYVGSAALQGCLAAVCAATLAAGCREVHGEAPVVARPVKVMEARPTEVRAGARYSVGIQPYQQTPLAFKVGGYVDQVTQRRGTDGRMRALQAGDVVTAGEVVARLRDSDYRQHVNQATASLREAEASQTKAQLDLERARVLFAAQSLTKPELDSAQAAFDAGAARIISAKAQLELAQLSLRDCALVAPISGIVLERKIEIGTLAGSGSVGFVLGDVAVVKAVFGVPDSLVHRIAPGQALEVTTEAFPGSKFTGRVTAVSPSADQQSRVFDVEITVANADRRLRPGMIGAVEVVADSPAPSADAPGSPAVPLSAIVRSETRPDQYAVFVVDETNDASVVRSRPVTLGGVQGNLVAVTTGLKPGERVVVMGATLLKNGDAVRVIP